MQVTTEDSGEITVTGNSCKRGEKFARQELTDVPVVPCRVSAEIPKDMIFPVMKEINRARVTKRIGRGEIIIPNVLGIGADIICTSDILKSGEEN